MERYEKIYPGAARIIFEEWDRQIGHRHKIEKSVIKTDNIKSIRSGLSLVGLAMLATAFITNRKQKDK